MSEASVRILHDALEPIVLQGDRILVGDLTLDPATNIISSTRGGSVKLTKREFILLSILANNAGRFVDKDELLQAVAGNEIDPRHSIVDTFVVFLHRQLQLADSAVTIEKVIGTGFRLLP